MKKFIPEIQTLEHLKKLIGDMGCYEVYHVIELIDEELEYAHEMYERALEKQWKGDINDMPRGDKE